MNILGEVTILTVSSCGHANTVEVVPGQEVEVRAGIATRPCWACQCASEAVRLFNTGDHLEVQVKLTEWMQSIIATNDHRAPVLMAFVRELV